METNSSEISSENSESVSQVDSSSKRVLLYPKNIWIMSLLMFVTLGLYHLYWQARIQHQIHKEKGRGVDGRAHAVLVVFTLGFYSLYWHMVLPKRIGDEGKAAYRYIYASSFVVGYILVFSGVAIVLERSLLILFLLDSVNAPRWNIGLDAWILIAVGTFALIGRYIAAIFIQRRINKM